METQFSRSKCALVASEGSYSAQSTRSKLAVLSEKIHGFEKQMETEAKQRRENEEGRLVAIKEAITKLEKTLNAETKRRVEANKALQEMFESQLLSLQDKVSAVFVEKFDQLQCAVDALNDRLTVVDKELTVEKEKQARDWEERNNTISKEVTLIKTSLEGEGQLRQERELQLNRRLGELECRADGRFELEKNAREQKYEEAHAEMEEAKRIRERNDEKFQTFALEEIAALKNGLILESQARESADDDIVQAVNHYTTALQDALRLVTTV